MILCPHSKIRSFAGILLKGSGHKGNQIGIDNVDETYTRLTNGIRDAIAPDVTMFVRYVLQDNKVIRIEVGEGSYKPYYLKSKGKTFSLDMISGLEAYAIGKAIDSKRYKVENTVNPKYEIDEYDLPLIEEVYEEIKFIMATQGYKMENTKATLNDANTLHTTRNGVHALGVYDGEKFEVLEGSEIDMSRKYHSENIERQRQTAIQNGDILLNGNKYILNVSVPFTSPSSAAIVPFPVSWTVKMKKKQKETQDILSYHTQAAGCSDKARAKASGGRQPIEECGRTGL